LLTSTGNYAAARLHAEEAVLLARELSDTHLYAVAVERLGWLAREQGDSATAWARISESLALFRELGDVAAIAGTLNTLAEVAIVDEDPVRAEVLLAESRAAAPQTSLNFELAAWALNHLGHAAQLRGDYDRAAQLHHESLALFPSDYHIGLIWAYHSLGETALGLGHLDQAARWLAQGLALSQKMSEQASIAWRLAGLGSVAALDEEPERAARLWGAAETVRKAIGCRPAPAARATYEHAMAVARAQLGDDAFAAAWGAERALTLEQVITEALQPGGIVGDATSSARVVALSSEA
jgi:tetratricopeptide (TPR) repeat protein